MIKLDFLTVGIYFETFLLQFILNEIIRIEIVHISMVALLRISSPSLSLTCYFSCMRKSDIFHGIYKYVLPLFLTTYHKLV